MTTDGAYDASATGIYRKHFKVGNYNLSSVFCRRRSSNMTDYKSCLAFTKVMIDLVDRALFQYFFRTYCASGTHVLFIALLQETPTHQNNIKYKEFYLVIISFICIVSTPLATAGRYGRKQRVINSYFKFLQSKK